MSKIKLELSKFKNIEPQDIDDIKNYLRKYQFDTCDYNIVNLFSWGHFLNLKWRMYKDRLLFYNFSSQFMLFPLGEVFSASEMSAISEMIENDGYKGNFVSVPEDYIEKNIEINDKFTPVYDEGNSDYLYLSENLASLGGKKLQKKKNLISQFRRNYRSYKTEIFRDDHIELCLNLAVKWCKDQNEICDEERQLEFNVLEKAIRNHTILGLEGLLLFYEENLVAFALFSEQKHDTATVHFEKYDADYKGSGQIINQETAIYLQAEYKYINREQDLGKEGLRKAKSSYAPERLIPTYRLYRK
ncbi:MAG: DUF2156 domain-containing protein [Candidatus Delongbacteria bacterium]|nr:DUF2156 domain-containing protein [Candidatus Delongbacteria bacterium]MCG2761519.1 phosphatidylglycerol lysyltransferase domain-containing protein [Candidatus Delongbacteria bacterium]